MPVAPPTAETKKPATPAPKAEPKRGPGDGGPAAAGKPAQAGAQTATSAQAPGAKAGAGPAPAGAQSGPAAAAGQAAAGAAPAAATPQTGQQRFDRLAVRAKLVVSEPGDALEREADEVAARVMRAPAPEVVPARDAGRMATPDRVQAKAEPAAGNDKRKPAQAAAPRAGRADAAKPAPTGARPPGAAAEPVKRKAETQAPREAAGNAPSTPAELIARLGSGVPLDADARAFFEQRLGRDLSQVRIHDDDAAADAARSLQARAFTWGNHIAFASGEYQPAGVAGRELLAHELAHVLQNDGAGLGHVVARKPGDNPKYKDPNDISKDAFDPAKDKAARPALETLALPAIKARHIDQYRALAGKTLKRPAGYDRRDPPQQTNQVSNWKKAVNLDAYYAGIGFVPGKGRQTLTFYGATNKILDGTEGELIEQMKIPKWTPDGSWLGSPLQVDHVVEVQVSGADAFENYELLTGAHNTNVGSLLRSAIYANVKGYLDATEKNTGDALVKQYLQDNDVPFAKVEGGGEGKNPESTAQFWSRKEIAAGKHLVWLADEKRDKKDEGTDKTRFALYSYTGQGFIDAFPLNKNTVTVVDSGRLAGVKLKSLKLNPDFETASGGAVGSATGTWELPSGVVLAAGEKGVFDSPLNSVAGKKYAGALAGATPPKLEVKGASPVEITSMDFVRGKLSADGTLTASTPLLDGLKIPVRWRGKDFAFEYTADATALAGKLPIPGVTIDDASVTLFYGSKGLGADGSVSFTVKGLGAGVLTVGVAQGATGPSLMAKGKFTADRKLFDLATLEIGWASDKGFYGSGTLGITNPDKIKGIKSAKISASYVKSVFSATGDVTPDIPGLKAASLAVTYGADTLQITGKLGIDDKVPGVEKADITVDLKQADKGWKVGASGSVTPKLPGLSGSTLTFVYDDGSVLIEGEFTIKKGPLDGKVKAGVTNAAVDDKGQRADKGEGKSFKVFGAADIQCEFIKDKLDGKLKLRLLPDGSVRVGGGLEVKDFEIFPKYPKDGGEFLNKAFTTPSVPIPGLGFAVGSVTVGVTFSATVTAKAHASVGPGKLTGITVTVAEFDPAHVDLATLQIGGGATFQVFADAGFGIGGQINLEFGAAVAKLVGSVGAEASAGLPTDKPVLTAQSKFTYSQAAGLDLSNTLNISINPELKFRLFGKVSAELNLLVDTITVWSKDWTLAEANYKLPVAINATGSLGYNSKTGKLRPENPSEAIKVEQPKIDADVMKGVVTGDAAPPAVKTTDQKGKEVPAEQLVCVAPASPNASFATPEPNQSVMPKRDDDARDPPPARAAPAARESVDEGVVARLGTGSPLDIVVRGLFEQRLGVPLEAVRIHTSPDAARETRQLGARAFTVGDHIAFADGEYRPDTADGQELLAHELVHVAQQRGGLVEPIVMRWPAVTRTPALTTETPASIRARTLADFVLLTQTQVDWATSPAVQADAAALGGFRQVQDFAAAPHVLEACGRLGVGDIVGRGIPAVFTPLRKYTEGVTGGTTAWLRETATIADAERWGTELATLEAAWSPANLSLVMGRPDPVTGPSPFEKLESPARPELGSFITYLGACTPVLSAANGAEVDSFLALRTEGAVPSTYLATVTHVKNYHHFTKATLDGLAVNEAFPSWRQQWGMFQRPLTVVLYPALDHNGAFHRNAGLQAMVGNSDILTIVVEGLATVADYRAQLAPVAARYGINGEIAQAMVGGHGNYNVLALAGSVAGAAVTRDDLGTSGAGGAHTTDLMTELTRLMSSDPRRRRIVLDACLTDSHHVASALRASPADAAADVNAAITADPSLRGFVAGMTGAGSTVLGANASFAPSQTTFLTPGSTDIGLAVPGDPDLVGSKLQYVEFGTEPEGCMRAVLECWATDQLAGTTACRDAINRRIAGGHSAHVAVVVGWFEAIIQALYDLAVNQYWGSGEALRRMGALASAATELYWPHHTTPGGLETAIGVLAGNPAHVGRLLGNLAADSHYAATPRVALVVEQVWVQHDIARRPHFMAALASYASALQAAADLDMGLVMPQVPSLLTLPAPSPPPADQLRLALLAAHRAPVATPPPTPLPAQIAYLTGLLGAGPTFPPALGISAALGGLASEGDILADIGHALTAAPGPIAPATPPSANLDPQRDAAALNDFRVTPLRRNGQVSTARDDLMVRATPTTASTANIFARLPTGTAVKVIGEFRDWYAIEQPGRSGFVAKRYITLLP